MKKLKRGLIYLISASSVAAFLYGLMLANWPYIAIGGVGLACVMLRLTWRYRRRRRREKQLLPPAPVVSPPEDKACTETELLVRRMLAQGRSALLLRPEIVANLQPGEQQQAVESLDRAMALVPTGEVVVGSVDEALDLGAVKLTELGEYFARAVVVEAMLLDRFPVTNRQFLDFVVDGGYETVAIWDEEVLPRLFEFVDQTGLSGPRYWRDQRYSECEADHPVVGICWYEAMAFARWIGKRLATDAEWVKAGCWPVVPRPGMWVQRKYPWGNAYDNKRANLWSSGIGRTVSVYEYPGGSNVAGVQQLIGNVWEWTSSNFGFAGDTSLSLSVPMKSIRGGAFDTYFESQATCHFQSGENPLSRKHNIGFRLALGVCDLTPPVAQQLTQGASEPSRTLEEVCA